MATSLTSAWWRAVSCDSDWNTRSRFSVAKTLGRHQRHLRTVTVDWIRAIRVATDLIHLNLIEFGNVQDWAGLLKLKKKWNWIKFKCVVVCRLKKNGKGRKKGREREVSRPCDRSDKIAFDALTVHDALIADGRYGARHLPATYRRPTGVLSPICRPGQRKTIGISANFTFCIFRIFAVKLVILNLN